jgi:hypothetical protein
MNNRSCFELLTSILHKKGTATFEIVGICREFNTFSSIAFQLTSNARLWTRLALSRRSVVCELSAND